MHDGPYFFVVNPAAGGGRSGRIWPKLLERLEQLSVDFKWEITRFPGEATDIAQRIPDDHVIVSVGGDGLLNEVVTGIPLGRTLGMIPTGRSNDIARTAGISLSPFQALTELLEGEIRPIDLPSVNGRPFLGVVSVTPQSGGVPTPRRIRVVLDGGQSEGDALFLAVGNCRYYSGGTKICPTAHFDDGLLDVVVAGGLSRLQSIITLLPAMRRRYWHARKFHRAKTHTLFVDGPQDMIIRADGELAGHLPATFTVLHRALKVVLPKGRWSPSKVVSLRQRLEHPEKTEVQR